MSFLCQLGLQGTRDLVRVIVGQGRDPAVHVLHQLKGWHEGGLALAEQRQQGCRCTEGGPSCTWLQGHQSFLLSHGELQEH